MCETCELARDMWPHYKVGSTGCKWCMARLIGFALSYNLTKEEKQARAKSLLESARWSDPDEIRELVKRKEWYEKVNQTANERSSETADKAVSKTRSRTARKR